MRQLVLDTETTGIDPKEGHRLIEVGCVELINRRLTQNNYHVYLNPEREIDEEATRVHGLTWQGLQDKPLFAEVADAFLDYVKNSEVIIHNAPFDVGFIDAELARLNAQLGEDRYGRLADYCRIFDSLVFARQRHPGQRNSLDALCKRYSVDHLERNLHGALLDAQILAEVYLNMTGGQTTLFESALQVGQGDSSTDESRGIRRLSAERPPLKVLQASAEEVAAHQARCAQLQAVSGQCLWWPQT